MIKLIKSPVRIIRLFLLRKMFYSCGKNVYFGTICELRGAHNITIGDKSCFGDYLYLTSWDSSSGSSNYTGKIIIGGNCNFGAMNHITCVNKITIGNNVLTGKWVTITDNSHGKTDVDSLHTPPLKRQMFSKGQVTISDNVWIGDGARILPGVTIGKGAVIGANSVVTKDVPPYSVACGVPAKVS